MREVLQFSEEFIFCRITVENGFYEVETLQMFFCSHKGRVLLQFVPWEPLEHNCYIAVWYFMS